MLHRWKRDSDNRYYNGPPEGMLRLITKKRRERQVAWHLEDLGISIAVSDLRRIGVIDESFPHPARVATARIAAGDQRIFYEATPGWLQPGEIAVVESQPDSGGDREGAVWESFESDDRESEHHGVGWCSRGHGPFIFDPAIINAAVLIANESAWSHTKITVSPHPLCDN